MATIDELDSLGELMKPSREKQPGHLAQYPGSRLMGRPNRSVPAAAGGRC